VLDHLTDSEGPQTVSEIIAGTGLSRNTAEQAIHRAVQAEQIERMAPGVYKLVPPKPLPPLRPEPEPQRLDGRTMEEWLELLERWDADRSTSDREGLGPWPGEPGNRLPWKVSMLFNRRLERRKAQAAADAELRDKLIAACHGNFTPGPGLDDLAPIKMALEIVPLDRVLSSIRCKTDRKLYPRNEPATSWREPRLLKAIAEDYCQSVIVPSMVDAWSKAAAKAPEKPVEKPVQRAEASPGTPGACSAAKRIHGATGAA